MRVLLIEPAYRKSTPKIEGRKTDDTLWYPPLSLLKLARFHKDRGDEVKFVSGFDPNLFEEHDLFSEYTTWDRVYITTLFTFHFDKIVKTINDYIEAIGGTVSKVYVGGIMASIMPDDIFNETGVSPIRGIINSPSDIRLEAPKYFKGQTDIDLLAPDYSVLTDVPYYAINETYYGYTSRGCTNKCPWCGVPKIEPEYNSYIDIKPMIRKMRADFGDKPKLKLMDNNVLASKHLKQIVKDLVELGYSRDEKTEDGKQRVVDFNQGLDATFLTDKNMKLLSKLNISPMRIAFDRAKEKKDYIRAVKLAASKGVKQFSNYMLYNWKDTPADLLKRLEANIELNEKWRAKGIPSQIYCYPMRFAPIYPLDGKPLNRKRDYVPALADNYDLLNKAVWTKKFVRSIEVMKGAAHGAISPTISLAKRALGSTNEKDNAQIDFKEFLAALYMPEELLRNRNKYEKKTYDYEPDRPPGTGDVERFRVFIIKELEKQSKSFQEFHNVISQNSKMVTREYYKKCKINKYKEWLKWYLK
ncbi:MAG: hypothetical protein KAS23_02105 [Anaerohalosphaera sp.]|nr:hypothetical protein [Anaerohalosphaera sp.]